MWRSPGSPKSCDTVSPKNFSDQLEVSTIWGFSFKRPLAFSPGASQFT